VNELSDYYVAFNRHRLYRDSEIKMPGARGTTVAEVSFCPGTILHRRKIMSGINCLSLSVISS